MTGPRIMIALVAAASLLPLASVSIAQGDITPSARPTVDPAAVHINKRDAFGMTPLHHAVATGMERIASTLLAKGANPNLQDNHGQTPLHLAAQAGRADLVSMLLRYHARTDIRDEDDMVPLQWAAWGEHEEAVALLTGAQ